MVTLTRIALVALLLSVGFARPGGAQDLIVVPDSLSLQVAVGGDSGAGLGNAGNSGAGLLGLRLVKEGNFSVGAMLHWGNQRVIASEGGAKVGTLFLNPHLEGVGVAVSGRKEFGLPTGRLGLRGRVGVSGADMRSKDLALVGMKLFHGNVSVEWMTPTFKLGEKEARSGISAGYAVHTLFSDLADDPRAEFRRTNIGSDDTSFDDLYVEFFTTVDDVRPFIRFHSFDAPGIIGFHGGEAVVGVEILGTLFEGRVRRQR